MPYRVSPSRLQGAITIPSSKSHTLRAILFASLARGQSTIRQYLPSPDTQAMIAACRLLGAEIEVTPQHLTILGTAGKPKTPENVIEAGNSGQVLRFVAAVAALTPGYTIVTGDASVRTNRPVQPLLDGLKLLGVFAVSAQGNGSAPIIIKGPLQGGQTQLDGDDSQPVSALLIASAFAPNPTTILVNNPGETPWIELTLDWFRRLNIEIQHQGYTHYTVMGQAAYPGFDYTVPGDFSSCAFPLVAALITDSALSLQNLDMQDVQGDKALIMTLQEMGARIIINADNRSVHIEPGATLIGQPIDVNRYIDALPILAVLACFARGETLITGAAIARKKESDRLAIITQMLQRMGAAIEELPDGLRIQPATLQGAKVSSFADHRIAMALTVAGLAAKGETVISDTSCVEKSYPNFVASMQQVGAILDDDVAAEG